MSATATFPTSPLARVTHSKRCPICGKPDWCSVSHDGRIAVCMRIASDKPVRKGGGYVHKMQGATPSPRISSSTSCSKLLRAELDLLDRQCRANLADARLSVLSTSLGVSAFSLQSLGVGWHAELRVFTFPMRDEDGAIVGIRTRTGTGEKRCVKGSRLGIAIGTPPAGIDPGALLVTEGESDCAAALDLGYHAIGRPGCASCTSTVIEYVARTRPARVAIVADGDDPGQKGGHSLARAVASRGIAVSVLTLEGAKDLREWKANGGTHHHLAALLDRPADYDEGGIDAH